MKSIRFPTTVFARMASVSVAANTCVSLGGALVRLQICRPGLRESCPRVMQPTQRWDRLVRCLGKLPCLTIQY